METLMFDKEKWLEENRGLIAKIANRFYLNSSKFSYDDLLQEGYVTALHAMDKFDPTKKSKLSTYVYSAVYRAIRDLVKRNKNDLNYTISHQNMDYKKALLAKVNEDEVEAPYFTNKKIDSPASPTALRIDWVTDTENQGSLKETIPSGTPPPIDDLIKQEQVDLLIDEIDKLPDRERSFVRKIYLEGVKCTEIANEQNITRQRVSQIANRALSRLKDSMKSKLDGEILV